MRLSPRVAVLKNLFRNPRGHGVPPSGAIKRRRSSRRCGRRLIGWCRIVVFANRSLLLLPAQFLVFLRFLQAFTLKARETVVGFEWHRHPHQPGSITRRSSVRFLASRSCARARFSRCVLITGVVASATRARMRAASRRCASSRCGLGIDTNRSPLLTSISFAAPRGPADGASRVQRLSTRARNSRRACSRAVFAASEPAAGLSAGAFWLK